MNSKYVFEKVLYEARIPSNKSFCITYNDENLGIGWVSKDSMPTKKPEEAMTFDSKEAAEKKMKELDEIYDTHFQVKPYSKSIKDQRTK